MPLFASLSNTQAFADIQDPSTKRPAFPPTAVQLYSSKYINFISKSVVDQGKSHVNQMQDGIVAGVPPKMSCTAHFEALSYQAAQVTETSSSSNSRGINGLNLSSNPSGDTNNSNLNPNLGVWDCRVDVSDNVNVSKKGSRAAELLKGILRSKSNSSVPTFILSVNLDDANEVHPDVATMISAIVQYCSNFEVNDMEEGENEDDEDDDDNEQNQDKNNSNSNTIHKVTSSEGTTNLSILKSVKFGQAPVDTDLSLSSSTPPSLQSPINVNIILCGIFSKKKDQALTYKDKQAANLISYHLQKFASDLNCTLCFVRDDESISTNATHNQEKNASGGENDNNDQANIVDGADGNDGEVGNALRPKGMTVDELSVALKRVCVTMSPLEAFSSFADGGAEKEGQEQESEEKDQSQRQHSQQQQPSLYAPHQYDIDLIGSVLLRGASCPGVWNANTESLWAALPPSSSTGTDDKNEARADAANAALNKRANGDEEWLMKLSDSVNAYVGSMGTNDNGSVKSSDQTVRTTRTNGSVATTKKKVVRKKPSASGDKKEVADFFAGLLNK